MAGWRMFVHKIFFIALLFFVQFVYCAEFNIEVSMANDQNLSAKEIDHQLELIGMEKIFYSKIQELKLSEVEFKKRLDEKKFDKEETFNFYTSFFTKRELIKFAPLNPQIKTPMVSGVLKGEVDDGKIKDLVYEYNINADELRVKTFYLDLDIDLIGNTKWDDFGLSSSNSFISVLQNSIKDEIEKKISGFNKVIILNSQLKESLNENSKYLNEESVVLNYQVNIKRSIDDTISKKTWYEISSQYNLINPFFKNSLGVMELPIQKKLLQSKNKQELNSTVVSIVFNLLGTEFDKIQKMISSKKTETPLLLKLEGQKYFSDIYLVMGIIENYFKSQKVEVSIGQLGIEKAELRVRFPGLKEAQSYTLLKTLDNHPLSNDPNEQKILVFDSLNNSLQIVQKTR